MIFAVSAAATAEGKYPYSFGRSNATEAAGSGAAWEASAGTDATGFAATGKHTHYIVRRPLGVL